MNPLEIIINVIISLICGFVSGLVVYILTKRKEKQKEIYNYWYKFLFDALEHCEMYIPVETLKNIKYVDNKNGKFHTAIQNILDNINPYGHEDKYMSDKEIEIFNNFEIAFEELNKWKNKQH